MPGRISLKMLSTLLALSVPMLFESSGMVLAWTPAPSNHPQGGASRSSGSRSSPSQIMYAPTSLPTSETPSMTAQKMLKDGAALAITTKRRTSATQLSQSVLASSDTLPSFPTSHGLLSPETVQRMEEMTSDRSEALVSFFRTYKRHGPMSCLPMLSDPDILPHLTNAMRDCML